MRWPLVLALTFTLMSVLSCDVEESDNLAKAQACLDKVPQGDPDNAEACMQYIAQYDTQPANILKCSIKLTSGGLVESKVVLAFNALKTDTAGINPSAQFLGALALDVPTPGDGVLKAKAADVFCQKTGIKTIKAISALILTGTIINNVVNAGAGFSTQPPNQAELDVVLQGCADTPGTCDPASVGIAVTTIAENYCSTPSADEDTCNQIEQALTGADDNTEIGAALFCFLDGRTYDFGAHTCP